ncbi:ABC transporter ATP-binding protein [Acuticoccus sp.]|uniref:ABC transporter ATP-binding protein n=1 Tax=Acuticoccus sp. TaxID=1904378 RepID=UPI003B51A333
MTPILEVEDLTVQFRTNRGTFDAVRGISFEVGRERVGIVGESGSGKSMTGRAILGLTPKGSEVTARRLAFKGRDLLKMSANEMRELRGGQISMVMQDPKYSLNPLIRIGAQIAEAYRVHGGAGGSAARDKALAMLEAVHIRDPERVYKLYPHEVSGGMGQRVMISMMLAGDPDLLIADEPTSALDVTVQTEVLRILDELVERRGLALVFISHDLDLVAGFCDRVLVMYAGQIVEELDAADLASAQHPYSRGLLASLPRLGQRRDALPVLERDPRWREAV